MSLQTVPGLTSAALLALALLAAPAAAQELYQWKDANGVTHYSDTPPPAGAEHSVRHIGQTGTAGRATGAEAGKPAEPGSEACTAAKSNLELLSGDEPVGEDTDGDGVVDRQLDPEQRQAQLQLAEAAIRVHCKQPATPD